MKKKLINCNACGKDVAKSVKVCPHCGKTLKKDFFSKFLMGLGIFFILIIIITDIDSEDSNTHKTTKQIGLTEALASTKFIQSDDYEQIPLPQDNYDIYFLGEAHGNKESKQVLGTYLSKLDRERNVRRIIIEEDWMHNNVANDYILSRTSTLPLTILKRRDILETIRLLNLNQKEGEKYSVHLVDMTLNVGPSVKSQYDFYARIFQRIMHEQPPLAYNEFYLLPLPERQGLYKKLLSRSKDKKNDQDLYNLMRSEEFIEKTQLDPYTSRQYREDTLFSNVQYFREVFPREKFLVYYGAAHGLKTVQSWEKDNPYDNFILQPLAFQLENAGVRVHSLACFPVFGESTWSRGIFYAQGVKLMRNGKEIPDLTQALTDIGAQEYLYFSTKDYAGTLIRKSDRDTFTVPSMETAYDGVILLKKVTPMQQRWDS